VGESSDWWEEEWPGGVGGLRARGREGAQGRRYVQVHQKLKKQEVNSRGLFFFEPSCPKDFLLPVSSSKLLTRKL